MVDTGEGTGEDAEKGVAKAAANGSESLLTTPKMQARKLHGSLKRCEPAQGALARHLPLRELFGPHFLRMGCVVFLGPTYSRHTVSIRYSVDFKGRIMGDPALKVPHNRRLTKTAPGRHFSTWRPRILRKSVSDRYGKQKCFSGARSNLSQLRTLARNMSRPAIRRSGARPSVPAGS